MTDDSHWPRRVSPGSSRTSWVRSSDAANLMSTMKKTRAQLDAEIEEILRRPIIVRPERATPEPLRELAERVSAESKLRQKRLHQALLRHPALIVTDRRGRQTILFQSGVTSNPAGG